MIYIKYLWVSVLSFSGSKLLGKNCPILPPLSFFLEEKTGNKEETKGLYNTINSGWPMGAAMASTYRNS